MRYLKIIANLKNSAAGWDDFRADVVKKIKECIIIPLTHDYLLNNTQLERVNSWTYLGVEVDSKLTWNNHCEKVCRKGKSTLGVIQRTLYSAPKRCKTMAYTSLVRPKLLGTM